MSILYGVALRSSKGWALMQCFSPSHRKKAVAYFEKLAATEPVALLKIIGEADGGPGVVIVDIRGPQSHHPTIVGDLTVIIEKKEQYENLL